MMHAYIQLMGHRNPYVFQIQCFSGHIVHLFTDMQLLWTIAFFAYILFIKALCLRYWADSKLDEGEVG